MIRDTGLLSTLLLADFTAVIQKLSRWHSSYVQIVKNKCCLFHNTDSGLTECVKKINRMDIVHLMESSMEKSRDHGRTYAEIEQTMVLDHSEGENILTHA